MMISFAVYFCIIWQNGLKSADEMHEAYASEDVTYVDATLLEMKVIGEGRDREYEFLLEYTVKGETYTAAYSGWQSETGVNADGIFRVRIRPDNPEKIEGLSYSNGVFARRGNDRQKLILAMGNSMGYMGYLICGIVVLLGIRMLVKAIKYNKKLEKESNTFANFYSKKGNKNTDENPYRTNVE